MLTISAIWVDQTIENHPETPVILARFKPEIPVTYIDDISKATHAFNNQPNAFYKGKKIVLLTSLKGDILKPCPGTHHYLCCGYEILNSGLNCQFNCAYCYLQTYMTTPFLTIFVNLPERVLEISQLLDTRQRRIGTGEFTDSLVLDPVTNHSQLLINTFRTLPNILLELKTKSLNIANLLLIPASRNSVVSWSLNPQTVINALEPGLPSLIQRL